MLTLLRELMGHAEWANAVFFHAWGKSPARDHEEMRRRVGHIIGVQQGFLAILRGRGARESAERPAPIFRDVEGAGPGRPRRAPRLRGEPGRRGDGADGPDSLVSGPALCHHGRRGPGAGGDAHAAPSRPVHDAAQGFRRRAEERGLDHLAVEAEARGALGLIRPGPPSPAPCGREKDAVLNEEER